MKAGLILMLIVINLLSILFSQVSFKWSAMSPDWKGLLRWQIIGNILGFISVLTLTALLKFIPLHEANAITVGIGFILVQVIGAQLIFHEPVSRSGWMGAGLITAGILLISVRR
jgi:multidrug transporter EmrE-like cation transporter